MFILTWNSVWIGLFFTTITWLLAIILVIIYVLPRLHFLYSIKMRHTATTPLSSVTILFIFYSLVFLVYINWQSPNLILWFNHFIFVNLQLKLLCVVLLLCAFTLLLLTSLMSSLNKDTTDFLLVLLNLFYWVGLLFFATNLFTFIFLIEILTILLFLLLPVSYLFNNDKTVMIINSYNSNNLIYVKLIDTLLFFYWLSYLTSIFVFLILFFVYSTFYTLEFTYINTIFMLFFVTQNSILFWN